MQTFIDEFHVETTFKEGFFFFLPEGKFPLYPN